MHPVEVAECLKSFQILIDTREHRTEKAKKRYDSFGVPYHFQTLAFSDYTYNFQMPNGKWLFDSEITIMPHVGIERKMSLTELSNNLAQERERFAAEFKKATDQGAKIYLLVENATFENLYNGRYHTKFNPNAYTASLWAWCARYNVSPIFCKAETSGKIIKDILYRELKEKLEGGFYG